MSIFSRSFSLIVLTALALGCGTSQAQDTTPTDNQPPAPSANTEAQAAPVPTETSPQTAGAEASPAAAPAASRAISACDAATEVNKLTIVITPPKVIIPGQRADAPPYPQLPSVEDMKQFCQTMKAGCLANCEDDTECQALCQNEVYNDESCAKSMDSCREKARVSYDGWFAKLMTSCRYQTGRFTWKGHKWFCFAPANALGREAFTECIRNTYLKACENERDYFSKRITGCVKEGAEATPRAECQKRILACEKEPTSSPYCNHYGVPPRDGWMQIRSPFLAKESKEVSSSGAQLQTLGKDISKDFSDAVKVSEEIQKGQAPSKEGIEAMYYGSVIQSESQKVSIDTAVKELQAAATARAAASTALEKATTDEEKAAAQESLNKANQDLAAADQKMKALKSPPAESQPSAPADSSGSAPQGGSSNAANN